MLKGLVTRREVGRPGTVELIRLCDNSVVSPDLQHVLCSLWRPAIDREGVVWMVDGPPVRKVGLEGSLDFPVLDEVLNKAREIRSKVVCAFGWRYTTISARRSEALRAFLREETDFVPTPRVCCCSPEPCHIAIVRCP